MLSSFCVCLCSQLSVRRRFSMKCFLMKNLLEVSTSGNNDSIIIIIIVTAVQNDTLLFERDFWADLWLLFHFRCTSPRGYRVPPCALINLSHGGRVDHTSHKLTAIVKPQPAAATNFNSQRQLGGLNHSPRSPFIPMQVRASHIVLFSFLEF